MKFEKKYMVPFVSLFVFVFMLTAIYIPFTGLSNAGNSSVFNVSLTINNAGPTITWVQNLNEFPTEGSQKTIYVLFNASDSNGVADIPSSSAQVIINNSGSTHTSSGCVVSANTATVNQYNCTLVIDFYDSAGRWSINASVYDGASSMAQNITEAVTLGYTYGIRIKTTSLTFSGTPGQQNVAPSNQPQVVNNSGNGAFTQLSLTAFDLQSGSNIIGVGNFTVNTTDASGNGQIMLNNSGVVLTNSAIAVQGNSTLYVYLDIPTPLPDGSYTSEQEWTITAS